MEQALYISVLLMNVFLMFSKSKIISAVIQLKILECAVLIMSEEKENTVFRYIECTEMNFTAMQIKVAIDVWLQLIIKGILFMHVMRIL